MAQDHLATLCSLLSLPQESVTVSILPSRKSPWPVVPPYIPSLVEAVHELEGWLNEAGAVWFAR